MALDKIYESGCLDRVHLIATQCAACMTEAQKFKYDHHRQDLRNKKQNNNTLFHSAEILMIDFMISNVECPTAHDDDIRTL